MQATMFWLSRNLNLGNVRRAYETWHSQVPVDGQDDAPWYRLVKSHLSPSRDLIGKRVLEIGCGRGGFACWLASLPDRPLEVVAADFSVTAVEKGRTLAIERGLSGIAWEVCDIHAIAHPEASFDTVICCETIEHVFGPREALFELARVLKPGGRLFLTTPNYLGIMGLYRIYLKLRGRGYTETGQPINRFMLLPVTRAWVGRSGLHVAAVDTVGHYIPFPGRPPIEVPIFNRLKSLTQRLGLHSLIVAEKR